MEQKINDALELAMRYGMIEGAHHKQWVIDQMVRALTGCPKVTKTFQSHSSATDVRTYEAEVLGESEEYKQIIADAKAGEDGPETYEWDEGIAP